MCLCIYVFMCLFVYVFMCLCVYAFMCLCVYVFMCLCVYVFMCLLPHLYKSLLVLFINFPYPSRPNISTSCRHYFTCIFLPDEPNIARLQSMRHYVILDPGLLSRSRALRGDQRLRSRLGSL